MDGEGSGIEMGGRATSFSLYSDGDYFSTLGG